MMLKISNRSKQTIEIIIEPFAETLDLQKEQEAVIESFSESMLAVEYHDNAMIIYEDFGPKRLAGELLHIRIDNQLVYPVAP